MFWGVRVGRYFHSGRGLTIFSPSHNWKDAFALPYNHVVHRKPVVIADFVWVGANVTIFNKSLLVEAYDNS